MDVEDPIEPPEDLVDNRIIGEVDFGLVSVARVPASCLVSRRVGRSGRRLAGMAGWAPVGSALALIAGLADESTRERGRDG